MAINEQQSKEPPAVGAVQSKKDAEEEEINEVAEDEFNIQSTVGVLSALILSCIFSAQGFPAPALDMCDDDDDCRNLWGTRARTEDVVDIYNGLFAGATVCCMVSIMHAVPTLINFQRIPKKTSKAFRDYLGPLVHLSVHWMGIAVILSITGSLLMMTIQLTKAWAIAVLCITAVAVVTYAVNEHALQTGKRLMIKQQKQEEERKQLS